jgi:hypothetical protein
MKRPDFGRYAIPLPAALLIQEALQSKPLAAITALASISAPISGAE